MKKGSVPSFLLFFMLVTLVSGCALSRIGGKVMPTYDEVLIYDLPYDLVYLRSLEALESLPDWELEETEKEKGIIRVRNINFSTFTDADQRTATVLVTRINRQKTSVALAPHSRHVVGGGDLLERVSLYLSREL